MPTREPIGVFISSKMGELAEERREVQRALTTFDRRLQSCPLGRRRRKPGHRATGGRVTRNPPGVHARRRG